MLDEVEVFIGELRGNIEAGWGVVMRMREARAMQILSTDLAVLLAAGAEAV